MVPNQSFNKTKIQMWSIDHSNLEMWSEACLRAKSLAAQVTQSRLTFIIGAHSLAARRYNICVADGSIGGGIGGRNFLFAGHLSPGSRLVDGHVDAVHNQLIITKMLKQWFQCGSLLVSMRIRIQLLAQCGSRAREPNHCGSTRCTTNWTEQGKKIRNCLQQWCGSALVSMRIRFKLFSSIRIRIHCGSMRCTTNWTEQGKQLRKWFFCPVALHTAPKKFMSIFQRALILRAV